MNNIKQQHWNAGLTHLNIKKGFHNRLLSHKEKRTRNEDFVGATKERRTCPMRKNCVRYIK